jgi:hypothetical protein
MAPPLQAERMKLAKVGKAQAHAAPGAPVGAYPTNSPGRAVAAKGRATTAEAAGRISPATEHGIDRRANMELGKAGRHGGILKPSTGGAMKHPKPVMTPVATDRGSFKIKG